MKEFDYEKAKAGAPVCTRDGRPARIICWDANAKWDDYRFPIVALIDDDVDGEVAQTYATDGRMYPKETRDDDLMMAGIKHEGWLYLYHDVIEVCTSHCVFRTKEDASKAAREIVRDGETQIIKIEWEE